MGYTIDTVRERRTVPPTRRAHRTVVPYRSLEDMRSGKALDVDKRPMLPPAPPRPVFTNDKPVFLSSHQASRLPELSRQVLLVCVIAPSHTRC